jgi:uncharacterized protein (TIGR03083 family)
MRLMTTSTDTAALSRITVAHGCRDEYAAFASLVASLSDSEWSQASRCDGFQVRDVAGHVIGLAEDVAAGKPGTRNAEEEAASVRGDTPAVAAARLRAALEPISALLEGADDNMWAAPVLDDMTLGEGVLLLWYDAYVHADDIRAAIGRPSERGAGLAASVAYLANELTKREYPPCTLALAGMPRYDVSGGGAAITGDALSFVLAATGRADAASIGLDSSVNIYA